MNHDYKIITTSIRTQYNIIKTKQIDFQQSIVVIVYIYILKYYSTTVIPQRSILALIIYSNIYNQ